MIKKKYIQFIALAVLSMIMTTSCERDVSDDAVLATFPSNADVYTDNPVGLTDEFFISFNPADGANPEGFGTDQNEAYVGTSSIRLDIPAPNDPDGGFIGGIFKDRGEGRNLTEYDALTFWVKASRTALFDEVGFGFDFELDKYTVARTDIQLSTDWRKVIIPIPDPSKLIQEKGMFFFSTGTSSTDGVGFTIWIDEIRFENLGTIAQPQPRILNGENISQQGFINVPFQLTGLTQTFNTESGRNVSVNAAPSFFDFSSSNPGVATVDEFGLASVIGEGEVTISASLDGVGAQGSLSLNVEGGFNFAPDPTQPAENVVSIFSDAYQDIPVSRYNSFFEPFQNTLGGVVPVGPESIISYTDLNFVGIVFNDVTFPSEAVQPVNATNLTHLHVDINVQEAIQANDRLLLQLTNYGASETVGSFLISGNQLVEDQWVSFDIPLSDFSGLGDKNRIGLLLFNSEDGPNNPTISNIFLDNIYFYTE
ncbi:carbohydrate-binding protein [Psychroflexus sp. CAK8W]|uniref:Carbohydrate-binding protein n=1 Tax=Psychroflexus longus TaxID=2873596 RepID=A0ABS7XFE8_9FLAO|nr:carbohydrate-binding protein [Psychroflexus longus]MBZ9777674.1 carbohydrate-binding protein [Psychroflexus longus]